MEVMNDYLSGQRLFMRCLLIVVLLTALSGLWTPGQAAPTRDDPAPTTPSNPTLARDRFGYEVATATPDPYIDAAAYTRLVFDSSDDGFSGPVPIKFPFRFYENTYTSMFVSTNGLITFGRGDNAFVNRPIPYDTLPNNFIAPFWDDLSLGSNGGVFVRYFGVVAGSRSVIIEWSKVLNAGNEITFEAILYESGNITFRYKTMPGPLDRSTIGIEDPEGLDGLQFVYNSAGLLGPGNVPYEVRFTRPAPFARVKILPRNSSNFAVNQASAFQMTVRNSGDAGPDTFDLTTQVSDPKWRAQINSLGGGGLSDTNGNGIPDTGQIAAGQAVSISLVLRPNSGAGLMVGDYTNVVLRATSTMIPEAFITATVQTAVPVPFAQIYVDPNGIHLRQTWEKNIIDKDLTLFTGKTLAVREISGQDYLVAWEKRSDYYNFTEIEYQVVNQLNPVGKLQVLSNSQEQLVSPVVDSHAETPTIAVAPNEQIGVVWSQRRVKGDGSFNTKIFLTFMDVFGSRITNRVALTDDESFYISSSAYNRFTSHNLVATDDNRFFACWLLTQKFGDGTRAASLKCGIYALNGTQLQTVVSPFTVDSVSGTGGVLSAPYMARLSGNRVLIVYNRSTGGSTQVVYSVWSSAGAQALSPTVLSGVVGSSPVGVQFVNGNIMLAWADQSGQLGYAYLNNSYVLQAGFPKLLPRVTQRAVAYPSLTVEKKGRAVVTWVDADTENSNYLYYLLLNQDGNIANPAMFFHHPIINTSTYGFGSAAYKGVYQLFMPFTNR